MMNAEKLDEMSGNNAMPFYFDPVKLGHILMDVFERAQPILQEYFQKHGFEFDALEEDPLNVKEAYAEFLEKLLSNPQKIMEMQARFWSDYMHLWSESAIRFMGGADGKSLYEPEKGDRRFRAPEWGASFYFNFLKQYYLMASEHMIDMVEEADDLDEDTRRRLKFFMQQFVNALAPTNFLFTNPVVLRETLDSNGENLIKGLENLLEDIERGHGDLSITTTDYDAFKLGENIATTPGKVVYQNELMQLIQYEPQTKEVFKTPLLIVPPWINKYYILDLQEKNSFIKWLVSQGHTVFIISWVNPDEKLAQKRFEDYMTEGVIEALDQIKKETGEEHVNAIGYCLGGTLLSVTLAYFAAKKQERIKSATFLTTMVDFEQAGDMKLFIDEHQLSLLDKTMCEKGVFPASALRKTFSYLRANDMIWSFVVNNYLMGREPFPFDLLYWNDDATNMPAAMHSFYMRKCYKENLLPKADAVTMNGTKIDMGKVTTPAFFLSAKDDHIAPWKATYATTQLFSGPTRFTLSASGHVAGVINPPDANKYHYWSSEETPADPDQWLANLKSKDGSWWPHWQKWMTDYIGDKVPARKPGANKLKIIEDAPGSYVRMKSD